MKTSNYIVTAFLVFIFGAMLFLFIAAKNHKEETWNKKEYALADFTVIVAEPTAQFSIEQNDTNRLIVNYPENESEPKNLYRISSDTLFVLGKTEEIYNIVVNSRFFPSVVALKESQVDFRKLQSGSLFVYADRAKLSFNNEELKDSQPDSIGLAISVTAKHSRVDIQNTKANKIDIQADSASIWMNGNNIATFSAQLRNKTEFHFWGEVEHVAIEKDSSSGYYLNN
jgi:hypothetical protein